MAASSGCEMLQIPRKRYWCAAEVPAAFCIQQKNRTGEVPVSFIFRVVIVRVQPDKRALRRISIDRIEPVRMTVSILRPVDDLRHTTGIDKFASCMWPWHEPGDPVADFCSATDLRLACGESNNPMIYTMGAAGVMCQDIAIKLHAFFPFAITWSSHSLASCRLPMSHTNSCPRATDFNRLSGSHLSGLR